MRSESVAAYECLVDKDHVYWSRAYFKATSVCDMLCNNMCEAFNRAIPQTSDKLVITLMEMIINYLMKSGNFYYQVRGHEDDQHIVDINKKTCACNMWQLIGIPCIHGISAPLSSNHDPSDYIHNKYKKDNLIKAYAQMALKQEKDALGLKFFNQVKDPIMLKVLKQIKEPVRLKISKQVKEAV
ncbi:hypothetical protein Dsin_025498 [Dipteronia sinensis]|uniref:SWIM-type domain-containing protein n=1 Tax=Dipteronia sinensis TaxID=43782 RepID=A0AAD9ZXG6_9ROSI|nr:hypothetical protein Dsin_025498 [Dipteronia sinensis]